MRTPLDHSSNLARENEIDLDELDLLLGEATCADDTRFRRIELAIVSHYRRHEEDQEAIALALTRLNLTVDEPVARERVDEILLMLQHVHDPFIH